MSFDQNNRVKCCEQYVGVSGFFDGGTCCPLQHFISVVGIMRKLRHVTHVETKIWTFCSSRRNSTIDELAKCSKMTMCGGWLERREGDREGLENGKTSMTEQMQSTAIQLE